MQDTLTDRTFEAIKLNFHLTGKCNRHLNKRTNHTTKNEVKIQNLHTHASMYESMNRLRKHSDVQTRTCAYVHQPCTDAHIHTSTPEYVRSPSYTHTHTCVWKQKANVLFIKDKPVSTFQINIHNNYRLLGSFLWTKFILDKTAHRGLAKILSIL